MANYGLGPSDRFNPSLQQNPNKSYILDKLIDMVRDEPYLTQDMNTPKDRNGLPSVPHPWPFSKEPIVVGSPSLAHGVDRLSQAFPGVTQNLKQISTVPDQRTSEFLKTNPKIGGLYQDSGNIWIDPKFDDSSVSRSTRDMILMHELAHNRGYGEFGAYRLSNLLEEGYNPYIAMQRELKLMEPVKYRPPSIIKQPIPHK